jgi:hypothetical protein
MEKFTSLSKEMYDHGYRDGRTHGFHAGLTWAVLSMFGCVVVSIVALWLVGPLWLTNY